VSSVYALRVRHLTRGKRLDTGRMSDETWCGRVSLKVGTRVSDTNCLDCLDAIIRAGEAARRRKIQLARDAGR